MCFDYGHQELTNSNYDVSQVDTDLGVLKASGVNCLRLAYYGYGNPGVNYTDGSFLPEKLATIIQNWENANNWHFRIILGGDYGTMSPSDFASYDASVLETTKWAQTHGIEQLSLGNEQESRLSGMTLNDWIAHLHTLSDKVHAVYSGKVSYEFDSNYTSQYAAGGLGSLDLYGINLYCCFLTNTQQAVSAFGSNHVYISEFNNDRGVYTTSESTWAAALKDELAAVQSFHIPVYYFAYRDGGDGTTADRWALETSTGQRHLLAQVLGIVQAQ